MTRTGKLDRVRDDFIKEAESATGLAEELGLLPESRDQSVQKNLSKERIGQVSELSFLKIMLSFEVFQENTLVLYLMGEKANCGYQPDLRIGKASDERVAYQLLSGRLDFNIENDHLRYLNDPNRIVQVANFFFKNHSYNRLNNKTKSTLVDHARHIRNYIAHNSKSSKKKFDRVAKDLMKSNHGCKASELLLSPVKRYFERDQIQEKWTHLESYSLLFTDLAREIVPDQKD